MLLTVFLRTLLFYFVLLGVMRLTGKRHMGAISPFDFVVAVMIADLAAIPIADPGLPVLAGIIPLATLVGAEVLLSYLALKSERVRVLVSGRPSVLIRDGVLVEGELGKVRYCLDDLLEALRAKNLPSVADVEVALLETNGSLTVIPKSHRRPLFPADLQVPTPHEGLPISLIKDGVVNHQGLQEAGLDLDWLNARLAERGIGDAREVFFAQLDTRGNLFLQPKRG